MVGSTLAATAKVEAWKAWAIQKGYWMEAGSTDLVRGDIIVFKWQPSDAELDHIGIVASCAAGSLLTYEGNRGNQTVYRHRSMSYVAGIIRIAQASTPSTSPAA